MTGSSWQPHTVTEELLVDPAPVTALQALFDDGSAPVGPGDELPPLWHWVALPRWSPSSVLGRDGHPQRGSFLPPVDLPRRMFAGGEVRLSAPVRVGSVLRRESTVTSMGHKQGRSGELVLVSVENRLYDADSLCLIERQDLVYRGAATPVPDSAPVPAEAAAMNPGGAPLVRRGDHEWDLRTDPTLLVRFSAATANAHRIHYDWPYATQVEGYPGLVVHGPLMTLVLAEVARLEGATRLTWLCHRNLAPLFCGQPAATRRVQSPDPHASTLELTTGGSACSTLTLWEGETSLVKGNDHA
jgi:3-methylfumaryl-CoA hydratase